VVDSLWSLAPLPFVLVGVTVGVYVRLAARLGEQMFGFHMIQHLLLLDFVPLLLVSRSRRPCSALRSRRFAA